MLSYAKHFNGKMREQLVKIQKKGRPSTLLKGDSNTDVFL